MCGSFTLSATSSFSHTSSPSGQCLNLFMMSLCNTSLHCTSTVCCVCVSEWLQSSCKSGHGEDGVFMDDPER